MASAADLAAVRLFYSSVGYTGGVESNDRILVLRQAGSLVAAVRVSPEHDTIVLRGMYVSEHLRGQGIGSKLLERVGGEIGNSACWCVPFTHLERFYSRIGFRAVVSGETPGFLSARKRRYIAAGREVMVMLRPAGWVSESV